MYLSHYDLAEKPFQISTDPKFLWLGEKHKEALATLKYGILDNRGFLLLTGDVGTGKTTLINALSRSIADDVVMATVPNPGLEPLDFFNFVADAYGMGKSYSSKGAFLIDFKVFLHDCYRNRTRALLVIDEAQRLTPVLLEEIRLLSNIERPDAKLLNIFFVGQPEFNALLLDPENRALRQRITINFNIDPLTESETRSYMAYRLKMAGASRGIFTNGAVREIYRFSMGYPRLINIICDHALLTGYVEEKKTIRSYIIDECATDMKISTHIGETPEVRKREPDTVDDAVASVPEPPSNTSKSTYRKTLEWVKVFIRQA